MATIQGIYIALFGRPADPGGLAYWNGVTNNGSDLSKLIGQLTASPEYTARFAGKSSAEIVTTIYQSLFGRAPDATGLDFFTKGLASGTLKLETLAINILDGAQGADKTIVDNKTTAADLFTKSLDTPAEIAAYNGNAAAELGRAFLTKVTDDKTTIPSQTDVDKAVTGVVTPSGGQGPAEGGGTGGGSNPSTPTGPTTQPNTYKINSTVTPNDSGKLFVGTGNSSDGFAITTNPNNGIELGLSVRHRYGEVEKNGVVGSDKAVQFKNVGTEDLAFAYSVYKDGGLDTANHTYKLFIDKNPDTVTKNDGLTFILQGDGSNGNAYRWTLDADKSGTITNADKLNPQFQPDANGQFISIIDDGKSPAGDALQNIQPLRAYINNGASLDTAGTYDVTLSALSKTGAVEAESTVQVVVNNDATRSADTSTFGYNSTELWVGGGNSNAHFANATLTTDEGKQINLAISGRQSGAANPSVGSVSSSDGLVHFKAHADATNERFAYSVSSQEKTLDAYKIVMKIDTDPSLATKYVTYELQNVQSVKGSTDNHGFSKHSWVKTGGDTGFTKITDDGGDSSGYVSQNIENLSWFDSTPDNGALAQGRYDVVLEAWTSDGTKLIGSNHVVFDAGYYA